jgi:hypothetical protein
VSDITRRKLHSEERQLFDLCARVLCIVFAFAAPTHGHARVCAVVETHILATIDDNPLLSSKRNFDGVVHLSLKRQVVER